MSDIENIFVYQSKENKKTFILWSMNMLLHFPAFFLKNIILLSYEF